jgi:hypothetical protein
MQERKRGHAGKAIAAAVILGVVLVQWMVPSYQGGPAWPAVANVLDKQPSGEGYQVTSDTTLTPRLTFRSQSGDWCRQFRLDTANSAYEQIACRNKAGDWEQIARVAAESSPGKATYKAASGGNVLDDTLDQMMAGAPIGPDEERALLAHQWKGR